MDAGEGTLTLGNLVKTMGELEAVTVGELGALFAMGEKLSDMAFKATETADSLRMFHRMTGLSSIELQKFEGAAQQALVPAGVYTQTVENLTKKLAMLHAAGGDAGLSILGQRMRINILGKTAPQILEDIRASMQPGGYLRSLPNATQTFYLDTLGINAGQMEKYFDITNKEMAEYLKLSAVMSLAQQKQLDDLAKLAAAWSQLMKTFSLGVVKAITPEMLRDMAATLHYAVRIGDALSKWNIPERTANALAGMHDVFSMWVKVQGSFFGGNSGTPDFSRPSKIKEAWDYADQFQNPLAKAMEFILYGTGILPKIKSSEDSPPIHLNNQFHFRVDKNGYVNSEGQVVSDRVVNATHEQVSHRQAR